MLAIKRSHQKQTSMIAGYSTTGLHYCPQLISIPHLILQDGSFIFGAGDVCEPDKGGIYSKSIVLPPRLSQSSAESICCLQAHMRLCSRPESCPPCVPPSLPAEQAISFKEHLTSCWPFSILGRRTCYSPTQHICIVPQTSLL